MNFHPFSNMAKMLLIIGRTYVFRLGLKAIGGRWNPRLQAWLVPASRRPLVDDLAEIADIAVELYDPPSGTGAMLPADDSQGAFCPLSFCSQYSSVVDGIADDLSPLSTTPSEK